LDARISNGHRNAVMEQTPKKDSEHADLCHCKPGFDRDIDTLANQQRG